MKRQLWRLYAVNLNNQDEFVAAFVAGVRPASRVLSVGAGGVPDRKLLSHCEYRAHDLGQEPTTTGRHTRLDYTSDIPDIAAPDQSFDVILCAEVLGACPRSGRSAGRVRPNPVRRRTTSDRIAQH